MASLIEDAFVPSASALSDLKEVLRACVSKEGRDSNDNGDCVETQSHSSADTDSLPYVLVSNEDGVNSPGLITLVRSLITDGFCKVYVCAPQSVNIQIGVSDTKKRTLEACRVDFDGAIAFEVTGTPVDCVSLGLSGVLFPKMPSLVICGVSRGLNCGFHIFSSAAVAGARQAFVCGVPSLALSLDWKEVDIHEDELDLAARFSLPLIRAALVASQNGHLFGEFFLNINMPTPFSQYKGFRVTRQGTSRPLFKWQVLPSPKNPFGIGSCKQTAIGLRVAQLGLAASAVGAARRANSSLKTIEVESVAGSANGCDMSIHKKKHHFQVEFVEMVGDGDGTSDIEALQDGFVSITPLGLRGDCNADVLKIVAEWIGSVIQADPHQLL
ncbi:hypothetical protein KP509_34G065200 [Ceratopteris richardii]|uniref:Survival protein SurE-like phosphatase/nucleotidase domain-containing protein n=1 Tax=Ceratopteris richardii TaxID=49495 RepID=A0A8T2QM61_CERRI|nr:hypothetical protein KP509_34G065200 [Ceratopteris richardii]